MNSKGIVALIDELNESMPEVQEISGGLRDLLRLNLLGTTAEEVRRCLEHYERRAGLVTETLAALDRARQSVDGLLADGFPELAVCPISPQEMGDLMAGQASIATAIRRFEERQLTTVASLSVGAAEPQDASGDALR